jgi:hypothetical protein
VSLRTDTEAAVEAWLASTSRLQQLLTYKALNASGMRIGVSLDREIDALIAYERINAKPDPAVSMQAPGTAVQASPVPLYIDHAEEPWRCIPWSLLP